MIINLGEGYSYANDIVAELRHKEIQQNRLRFRNNLERLGFMAGYEISKRLKFKSVTIPTSLGASMDKNLQDQPVIASILRAGLPLHQGLLQCFDHADSAFVSAYRKHSLSDENDFSIQMEYVSCPELQDRTLIIADPMIATGASINTVIKELLKYGEPSSIHIVGVIASETGLELIKRKWDNVVIWVFAIDDELTAKGYIVPGLGDSGDLSFGEKLQN